MELTEIAREVSDVESEVSPSSVSIPSRDIVPGRTLHLDADSLCYQFAHPDEPLVENFNKTLEMIEALKRAAGADFVKCHVTVGSKGGRYQIAQLKEYQGNRGVSPEDKQDRINNIRDWIGNLRHYRIEGCCSQYQEADDAICQEMYTDRNAILYSIDKDLWMVPGLHLEPKTFSIKMYPRGYGKCSLDPCTQKAKLIGKGESFFWHQVLMGDRADNIPGLPMFSYETVLSCIPTKTQTVLLEKIRTGRNPSNGRVLTSRQKHVANAQYIKMQSERKGKPCGPVSVYNYLKDCSTSREAFFKVRDAYYSYYGNEPFNVTSWRGDVIEVTAGSLLLEQARLLWLRRVPGEDVFDYFKEVLDVKDPPLFSPPE